MKALDEFVSKHQRWRQFLYHHSRPLDTAQNILTLHDLGGFRNTGVPMPIAESEARLLCDEFSVRIISDNQKLLCFEAYRFEILH